MEAIVTSRYSVKAIFRPRYNKERIKMNGKLEVTLTAFNNVVPKYPETKDHIEENIKEACKQ